MSAIEASLYEQLFPLTTLMKQRVVENFSGATLNERWTTNDVLGVNIFAMADEINGGFKITTGGTSSDRATINFNNKRQYDPTACIALWVSQTDNNADSLTDCGLADAVNFSSASTNSMFFRLQAGNSFIFATSSDGSSSSTNTGVAVNANFRGLQIEGGLSSILYSIENALRVTKTTNRPTTKLEPQFAILATAATVVTGQCRYCEVFNK